MRWLKVILSEIYGLFVDDGHFAIAILLWLGACWLVLPRLAVPSGLKGPILFAGLAFLLLDSTLRKSRKQPDRQVSGGCARDDPP